MATDATETIVPGHGTVFIADPNTPVPASPLTAFGLSTTPTGWNNLGHTSKDNLLGFKKDGGTPTFLDTYLADSVGVVYSSTNWSLNVNPLQVDPDTLNLGFGGFSDTDGGYVIPAATNGVSKAMFVFMTDGTGALGFYIPNTNSVLGDTPVIDPQKFFELPLTASILAGSSAVIPASPLGIPGIMKVYKTGLSGALAAPTISTALPASQTTGDWIQLEGTGFTSVTAVTVGGVNATWLYGSDGSLLVQIPTGSAGSAPIIVTNTAGASSSKSYTRT